LATFPPYRKISFTGYFYSASVHRSKYDNPTEAKSSSQLLVESSLKRLGGGFPKPSRSYSIALAFFPFKCTPGRKSNGAGGCTYSLTVVGRDFSYFRHSRG